MADLIKGVRFVLSIIFVIFVITIFGYASLILRRGHNQLVWLELYIYATQFLPLGVFAMFFVLNTAIKDSNIKHDIFAKIAKISALSYLISFIILILLFRLKLFGLA